ncbi:MAG: isoleucine--tRNA ligase [Prevotellaceae bacterium]|jgi:isoleucyl-tRNA synthetase|nr:isoleucine--tRNA ligase [Prevotellaceae bacterium]
MKFKEYKGLNLSEVNKEVLKRWKENNTFKKSTEIREGCPLFVFYEGPPSANGMPGIHHVMARAIKDIFCRYKTMKGFLVKRKAGWDTHGLPVELSVEKSLGITKEDIGKKISVEEYNAECRHEVMKYTKEWEDLTNIMGYWVDMDDPYITYDNAYIESLWWLLKELYKKGLLYKGYTIQPYSPAAGTGLSTHELNQPGAYRDVKDTTCVAQFNAPLKGFDNVDILNRAFGGGTVTTEFGNGWGGVFFMAWTTTPWTLPSNTALCVGPNISYVAVQSYNPYTGIPCTYVLAKDLINAHFNPKAAEIALEDYKQGDKLVPFKVIGETTGRDLAGIHYEQLIQWMNPGEGAFRVITGDYVTTEDGTGIVHIAPTFGADDDRVAKASGIHPMLLTDKDGNQRPMVDLRGKFYPLSDLDPNFVKERVNVKLYEQFAGRYVKNEYDPSDMKGETLDVDICVMLKSQNRAFKIEKHTHNYPHCWRTDKPVLYYPLDSWFIKTTACKDEMIELNKTIYWKPESTGTGRFGRWLENLQDWNLSRSRYWGTPLPIWRTEDGVEEKCIGSVDELCAEIKKAIKARVMNESDNPYKGFKVGDKSKANYAVENIDLHRPFIDKVVLVSDSGKPMKRELDLIDVWFDSGAMPYAQVHYPFDTHSLEGIYPADFIAEGVDQTRGWFFTLHAIATMVFNSVSFKTVISNGLVLDKNGNKMSKRLGNGVDPFEAIEAHGSDPVRWYIITNAPPWDNLKFDIAGVDEVKRKFFGTLYNTYSFFALYANVDGFTNSESEVPVAERPEIDRWIISLLNTLIKEADAAYADYEPTRAGRLIQDFVGDNLSNWYVRLNRKRFWGGEMTKDKLAAYQTLYTCLETVAILAAPIAPFFNDRLFTDLNVISKHNKAESAHLADFPVYDENLIDMRLEDQMALAQQASSMVLALRRKVNIKVRQPLMKIMIPVLDSAMRNSLESVKSLILNEINVKELEFLTDTEGVLVKKIKANFKTLGPKHSKRMKEIAAAINNFTQQDIAQLEREEKYILKLDSGEIILGLEDVEISSEDIPGWLVATEGRLTIALDITITETLRREGIARELVNRIQNIRKDTGFDVTDKIKIQVETNDEINAAINDFKDYIASQTLAIEVLLAPTPNGMELDLDEGLNAKISVEKI